MAVERLQTLKLFDHLARLLAGGPAGEAPDDRLVYRERETPEDPDDSWQRRVLEVCDGRSVGEIKSMLYRGGAQRRGIRGGYRALEGAFRPEYTGGAPAPDLQRPRTPRTELGPEGEEECQANSQGLRVRPRGAPRAPPHSRRSQPRHWGRRFHPGTSSRRISRPSRRTRSPVPSRPRASDSLSFALARLRGARCRRGPARRIP